MALSAARLNSYSMVAPQARDSRPKGSVRAKSAEVVESFRPSAQQQASLDEVGGIAKRAIGTYQSGLKLAHGTLVAHQVAGFVKPVVRNSNARSGADVYTANMKTTSSEPKVGSKLDWAA